jgi:hypothetical protein
MTELTQEFVAAMVKAQMEMTAVVKGNLNPAFKSKYADLASVIDAVMPALNKHGIAMMQSPMFDGEVVRVDTFLLHSSGGGTSNSLSMRPSRPDPQGVGSAITYARRYALLAMCGVAPEDDDGQAASGPAQAGQRFQAYNEPPKTDTGVKRLSSARAKEIGLDVELKNAVNGCTTLDELAEWHHYFDKHTAQAPLSWLDSLQNMCLLRKEEIVRETGGNYALAISK